MEKVEFTPWRLFEESSFKYADNVLIISQGISLTYREVYDKTLEFAKILSGLDFKVNGMYLPNSSAFICCMLALNKQNKVVVPLSYQLKGESLYERINYADIELIITNEKGYAELTAVLDKIHVKAILALEQSGNYKLYVYPSPGHQHQLDGDGIFGICFTSGSTSKPKGVVISNYAMAGNALAVADVLRFEETDKFLIPRSFAQASPISGDILMSMSRGAGIVILNELFHPTIVLKTIQDYQVTTLLVVRTMLSQILDYPQIGSFELGSLRRLIFGGMITPKAIIDKALQKIPGIGLYNAYGMTEASTRVAFLGPEDILKYPESAGRPIQGCNIKIYREDGTEADPGEEGEIYVQSDYIMEGYYKHPELTGDTLTPRGLRSRDIGYKDDKGLLYVKGRSDDLMIQGGNNVYPLEIEEVLLRNKQIKEAVVLGVEDEKLGVKIVALISLIDRDAMQPQDVYKWCRANLEDKKIPKEIRIIDQIPKNEYGKINKNDLRSNLRNLK